MMTNRKKHVKINAKSNIEIMILGKNMKRCFVFFFR